MTSPISTISGIKRWNEDFQHSRNTRARVDDPQQGVSFLNHLVQDCIQKIFEFLSCEDILRIEQVCSKMKKYTDYRWQFYQKGRVNLNCSYEEDKKGSCLGKANYHFEKTLYNYIYNRINLIDHQHMCKENTKKCVEERAMSIEKRFENVQVWNPSLGLYIKNDLRKIVTESVLPEEINIKDCKVEDLLLKGLSALADHAILINQHERAFSGIDNQDDDPFSSKVQFANFVLRFAIEQGWICASFLAIKMQFSNCDSMDECLEDLAMFSADKGDYKALEERLGVSRHAENAAESADNIIEKYSKIYPPISAAFARDSDCVKEAKKKFNQALEGYGNDIPASIYYIGAIINQKFGDSIEADEYIERAIARFGEDIPCKVWETRATIKENRGDLKESINSLNKILGGCKDPCPSGIRTYYGGKIWEELSDVDFSKIKKSVVRIQAQLSSKNENETTIS